MNRKVFCAVVLAFALVSGFVWLGGQPAAQGQKPDKAKQWEYKIYKPTDADFAKNKAEEEFNKLAAEGWDYVGTIVSRVPQPGNLASPPDRSLEATTCVLFKRAKK